MEAIEFIYKGKTHHADVIVDDCPGKIYKDYHLTTSSGSPITFRASGTNWRHIAGQLNYEVYFNILDAIQLKFDRDCYAILYHEGVRQVVHISYSTGMGEPRYSITINGFSAGHVYFDKDVWKTHIDDGTWLTIDDMTVVIDMIESGELKPRT